MEVCAIAVGAFQLEHSLPQSRRMPARRGCVRTVHRPIGNGTKQRAPASTCRRTRPSAQADARRVRQTKLDMVWLSQGNRRRSSAAFGVSRPALVRHGFFRLACRSDRVKRTRAAPSEFQRGGRLGCAADLRAASCSGGMRGSVTVAFATGYGCLAHWPIYSILVRRKW